MHLTSNHHISRLTLPCVFATHSHSNGCITSHFLAAREKPEREKWCSFIQSCCRRRKRHFVPTVANRTRTATARLLQHITAYCADLCISSVCEYMRISYVFLCVCARLSQYALQIAEEWLRADSAAQLSISRNGSKMRCFISGVQNQFRSRKTCWQRADFCCVLQILLECLRQCWCLLQLRAPSELLQQACCGPFMFCRSEWGEVGPGSVFDFPK